MATNFYKNQSEPKTILKSTGIVTLLTDFGLQDTYVGAMKGVMLGLQPSLILVDLTHEIPPQQILAANFQLTTIQGYFPPGTVHLAVVDPGVGTTRRAIAVATAQAWLVGPDNGLFSGFLAQDPPLAAVELTNSHYWRTPTPSATFQGRDIFAPVAAHLAGGVPLAALGTAIDPATLITLPNLVPRRFPVRGRSLDGSPADASPTTALVPSDSPDSPDSLSAAQWVWQGVVQHIDRFGNLITSIPASVVPAEPWLVQLEYLQIPAVTTYGTHNGTHNSTHNSTHHGTQTQGQLVALVGSQGWVEVAVSGGSAQAILGVTVGQPIQVRTRDGC